MEPNEGKEDTGADVVVNITDDTAITNDTVSDVIAANNIVGIQLLAVQNSQPNSISNNPSPGIPMASTGFIPSQSDNKPLEIPAQNMIRRSSVISSAIPSPKPKSRFAEPPVVNPTEENIRNLESPIRNPSSPYRASPSNLKVSVEASPNRTTPNTPKTPLLAAVPLEEEEDDEIYKIENVSKIKTKKGKKMKMLIIVESITFICLMAWLATSLKISKLHDSKLWGLVMWKWCIFVTVIFCGRLFSMWFINILVFLIERNFLLRKKVLYFVYGLKKSVQACIWSGLVLLTWALLINRGVERSKQTKDNLKYVTRVLISFLVSAVIILIKTLSLKLLASSFHVSTFFDRIQESIFHQYVLQKLSGPPSMAPDANIGVSASKAQLSYRISKKGKEEEKVVDVTNLHKVKQGKVSAWTMKGLVSVVTTSGLSTLSETIEDMDDEESAHKDEEITCESEAKSAAYRIFRNVAKPGFKYIEEEDLLQFLSKEEVVIVLPLIAVGETRQIRKSVLRNWVVNVYLERKSLAYSLTDTKTAIKQLNKIVVAVTAVVIIILWLLLMGLATTEVLLVISSQMLLVVFVFGNTAKTVFEAIIFVFVMHPFDIGDRCVIDGVQLIVEEMNILSTVFLRYDNEKIYYPNAVLATKSISNMYRSPFMGDSVEFSIDISTTMEIIGELKTRIKMYIDAKPKHWNPNHSVVLKEIVNVNSMHMALYMTHTMNYQNMGEKTNRRSDLVWELKKIFEDLSIKYSLLPQEIQLSHPAASS